MRVFAGLILAGSLAVPAPVWAQNDQVQLGPAPDWAAPGELAAVPDNPSGLVFFRRQDTLVHLDARGETTFNAMQVKILQSQALEFGNVGLAWNPAAGAPTVHTLRIHRDGTVIDVLATNRFEILRRENQLEQAMIDGLLTATLRVPDLRVGDELELAFSIPSQDPTLGSQSFGALTMGDSPPAGRFRLGIGWTDGEAPQLRLSPEFEAAAQRTASGVTIRFDDPPPLNRPANAPARYLWQRIAEYSDFKSWTAVSQRFNSLFADATRLDAGSPLRAEAARIAAAKQGKLAQAQAALELVQQQVRYIYVGLDGGNFKPASADETWSRRYGDCKGKTVLLLALLGQLGIDAEAVLASNSGLDDGFDARLPSPGLFDHVLVRARIDGKSYWLDGTLPAVAVADVEPFVPYRWVLPLAADGKPLESLAWKPLARPETMELYEIDARGGFGEMARINHTVIKRGLKGLAEYVQFSVLSGEQLTNAFRSSLTGQGGWDEVDTVAYRYDPASRASVLTISGLGPAEWDTDDDDGSRSLTLPGGGFYPPDRRQRASNQDRQAPYENEVVYSCYVTTVRLPADAPLAQWSHNTAIDTQLYGRVFYRTWGRRDGLISMVRGTRTEQREIAAAAAQRDNDRLAKFDNSMAVISYDPGSGTSEATTDGEAALPPSWDPVWQSPSAPCLPPDLAGG